MISKYTTFPLAYRAILLLILTNLMPFSVLAGGGEPNACARILQSAQSASHNAWDFLNRPITIRKPGAIDLTKLPTRMAQERSPDLFDDLQYLEELKYAKHQLGQVDTRFIPELDSRFYFTSTARPAADASIPMVDPEAKALVIYFHGSGTAKAGGASFAVKANKLAGYGYSVVSFDMPYHRDGSHNSKLEDAAEFSEYIDKIVQYFKREGQPIYLVGHSFGPDPIAEYITRHPLAVNGAALISPGGFDATTEKWQMEKTLKMPTFDNVEMNDAGGQWAYRVTRKAIWKDLKARGRKDPTLVNPQLKITVVSGAKEEYVPGPLNEAGLPTDDPRTYDVPGVFHSYFANANVIIEPGVGHYIFEHNDANGHDVVLRTILGLNGETLDNDKAMREEVGKRPRSATDRIAGRYSKEKFFIKWMDHQHGGKEAVRKMVSEDDQKLANKLLNEYSKVEKQREEAMYANVKHTADWAPKFYADYKDSIDKLGTKGFDSSLIMSKYLEFLKTVPTELRRLHTRTTAEVYILPERPVMSPEDYQKRERPDKQKPAKEPIANEEEFGPQDIVEP